MSNIKEVLVGQELIDGEKSVVHVQIKELIPTAKYANIELLGSVTRVTGNVEEELKSIADEIEKGLEPKRDEILEELDGGN